MYELEKTTLTQLKTFMSQGRFNHAVKLAEAQLKRNKRSVFLMNVIGISSTQLGDYEKAERILQKALKLNKNNSSTYCNLGNLYLFKKDFERAIFCYEKAVEMDVNNPNALNNLGTAYKNVGSYEKALAFYDMATANNSSFFDAWFNKGVLHRELHRLEEAVSAYGEALSINPKSVNALNNLGAVYLMLGENEIAIENFELALRCDLGSVLSFHNLCDAYERSNQLIKLKNLIDDESHGRFFILADTRYYRALLSYREGDFHQCLSLCQNIVANELSNSRLTGYWSLKARALDALQHYGEAFLCFNEMNEAFARSRAFSSEKKIEYQRSLNDKIFQLKRAPARIVSNRKYKGPSPVFLVAFPRSGTTMLDSILRSHPSIEVLEEMPMLERVIGSLGTANTVEKIESMDSKDVDLLRQVYWHELEKHCPDGRSRLVVDKLPLNLTEMPLIHRLFPNARVILALRHPYDCVLSCFMQNFQLNDAMSNFLDLETTAKVYNLAMTTFKLASERYPFLVHRVRYEQVISDFDREIRGVLGFLNVAWDQKVQEFQNTAKQRRDMKTPSYSQVIRPLYKTSSYRYKNYAEHISIIKKDLDQWVSEYAYEDANIEEGL